MLSDGQIIGMIMAKTNLNILNTVNRKKIGIYNKPKNANSITSSLIDNFKSTNESFILKDGIKGINGTSIPYQYTSFSDIITNPSSVSISEFQKMVYTQPIISAGLTIINNLVKNEIGIYQHKNKKYEDFICKMIEKMLRPIDQIYEDLLTALWAGFSIGEKRYGSDGRFITVLDIEPRPAQSIIFRVDSQGHLKDDGIIQYYINNLWQGYGNLLSFNQVSPNGAAIPNPYAARGDMDYPWRTAWSSPIGALILPKAKCVHFVYKGLDGLSSPYGRSLLRPTYDSYLVRTEMSRIMRNAASNNSSPIPLITVHPNQARETDMFGTTLMERIAQGLEDFTTGGSNFLLLEGILNESISVTELRNVTSLGDLKSLAHYLDTMMLTSILYPSELAGLSDKGSYALGKTQQDLLGRNVSTIANALKDCMKMQVIKPLLQVNFNEQEDFGYFGSKDNVAEDVALNIEKIKLLQQQGIKLKPESLMAMLDINEEAIYSFDEYMNKDNLEEKNVR